MRLQQLTPRVWAGSVWLPVPVMIWFVKDEDGLTLVDGGVLPMWDGVRQALQGSFAGVPLRRVLLTHGHQDHIGILPPLMEAYPEVPILVHGEEIPFLTGERSYRSLREGVWSRYAPPVPEKRLEALDVERSCGSLRPYYTPGHSPGHTVFYHEEDDILLAGDLFTRYFGRLQRPLGVFTADMELSLCSGEIVEQLKPRYTACAHMGVVQDAHKQYPRLLGRR
ncbi:MULTISPECIES: MBL fold metallo-hydrolase [Paenibacillus]|uniref:MBL fold metallo-hydrolase n=1 Tax=Paenibacillus TaxID=44249 RepID=UPI0022B8B06F|nr:MBL fold metallo-hydrolase [Paenibacillus caseinilyticus]MCZ8520185.1 MBL fold metallo-hydrolase [Paenibacillus caseinilyticus]